MSDCDCTDCNCPHPDVCKNGDCKRNFVVLFTAKWCGACRTMYPTVEKLKAEGYIVYVVDVDQHKAIANKYKIQMLPTILIFDKGKEVQQFEGVTSIAKIKKHLKTREQQGGTDYVLKDNGTLDQLPSRPGDGSQSTPSVRQAQAEGREGSPSVDARPADPRTGS